MRTYVYNAAGMTTAFGSDIFSYNNRGRMIGATVGGNATGYLYNAVGQLIEKSGTSSATYVYDESGHTLGEYSGSGNLIEETVWLGDIPVATLQPSGSSVAINYVHTNHLNTPTKVTRASDNTLEWRIDQDPFGTASPNQNPGGLGTFVYNLRFPGQLYMAETGLNYNYLRDFDPQVGRYGESDPAGLAGGINTYTYAASDPVDYADPLGLAKSKTKGYWASCSSADWTYCEAECGSRGVATCKKWWYLSTEIVGGEVVTGYKPAPKPSCNCKESFCQRNPNMCKTGAAVGIGALILGAIAAPEIVIPACALAP